MNCKHPWAKKLLGGIGLPLLALALASCGGGGSSNSTSPASGPPPATGSVVITGRANQ